MNANTVYEVFLALAPDEKKKFITLINEQKSKASFDIRKRKSKPVKFTKEDAVEYLLATVFKHKNRP